MSNPSKRSVRRRLASCARVAGFITCLIGTGAVAAVVNAQGEARAATVELGRGLLEMRELLGSQTEIRINGNRMYAGGAHVASPLPAVLDRFEQHCRELGWQLDQNETESFAKSVQTKLAALGATSLTVSGQRSEDEGVVVCLLAPPSAHGAKQFLERAREFSVTGDLGRVGDIRYVSARKSAAGGTDVVTVWTEGPFNMKTLTDTEHDAPGSDLKGVARPEGSRRIMDVDMANGQYGLKSYRVRALAEPALESYARGLGRSGWREMTTGITPGTTLRQSRTFEKDGAALVVSAHAEGDGARVDILQMGSRGYSYVSAPQGG